MSEARKVDRNKQLIPLGVVFFSVGVVFLVALDPAAAAIPFLALGIAFFAWGLSATRRTKAPGQGDPRP
jgi:hypothetical protein